MDHPRSPHVPLWPLLLVTLLATAGCKAPGWGMGNIEAPPGSVVGAGHPTPIPKARGSYEGPDERDFLIRHSIPLPPT